MLSSIPLETGKLFKIDENVYVVRKIIDNSISCQRIPCFDTFDPKTPEKNYIILSLTTKIDED